MGAPELFAKANDDLFPKRFDRRLLLTNHLSEPLYNMRKSAGRHGYDLP